MPRYAYALLCLLLAITLAACGGMVVSSPESSTSPVIVPSISATSSALANPSPPAGEAVRVLRVVDGDTIAVEINGQSQTVRYIGIDTPETVHPNRDVELMGPEASEFNKSLVEGQLVYLERDVSETDRFGRLLRYVWVDYQGERVMVNAELVRAGFALTSTYPPDVKYDELFILLQSEARQAQRGLWSEEAQVPSSITPGPSSAPPGASGDAPGAPANWDGQSDLNCGDFATAADAQAFFDHNGGVNNDTHRLDGDGDGRVCESRP